MAHVTGLQSAQLGLVRLLEGWREPFSAREFAVLLDLLERWQSASGLGQPLGQSLRGIVLGRARSCSVVLGAG